MALHDVAFGPAAGTCSPKVNSMHNFPTRKISRLPSQKHHQQGPLRTTHPPPPPCADSRNTHSPDHCADSRSIHSPVHGADSRSTHSPDHSADSRSTHSPVHCADSRSTHSPVHCADSRSTHSPVHCADSRRTHQSFAPTAGAPTHQSAAPAAGASSEQCAFESIGTPSQPASTPTQATDQHYMTAPLSETLDLSPREGRSVYSTKPDGKCFFRSVVVALEPTLQVDRDNGSLPSPIIMLQKTCKADALRSNVIEHCLHQYDSLWQVMV